MASAAYPTTVKLANSTTATTGESFTVVSGKTYQVDADAKQVWDPGSTVTIKDNGSAVSASDIESVDMLFGKVTFDASYTVTGSITADFTYYDFVTVAQARSFSLRRMVDLLDGTVFNSSGDRTRLASMRDFEATVDHITAPETDLDSGAGTFTLESLLTGGSDALLEINFAGSSTSGMTFRGWGKVPDEEVSASVDQLIESGLTLQCSVNQSSQAALYDAGFSTDI